MFDISPELFESVKTENHTLYWAKTEYVKNFLFFQINMKRERAEFWETMLQILAGDAF